MERILFPSFRYPFLFTDLIIVIKYHILDIQIVTVIYL